jgi:hAT family C-terminal dimerisation region
MPSDIEMSDSDSSVADAEIFLNPAIAATITPTPERVIHRAREYIRYPSVRATEALLNAFNPINWWNKAQSDFPTLHLWALDTLAIPVMSAECERIFSCTKKLITPERNSLHEQIIKAPECLKNWWDQGLIQQQPSGSEDDSDDC